MHLPNIEETEVKQYLKDLDINKSPSPDGYHPKLLVELSDQICKPLTEIFKDSITSGVIPYQWKLARISAVLKKETKS